MTYVGELGWELHVANEDVTTIFDALMEAGKPFGTKPAGYRAIESLRLEKGYRSWGSDIGSNDTPFEAGLGFAVKLKSAFKFVGREASEANCRQPLKKMLVGFTCERPETILLGGETILRNQEPVGYLTSGGFGHTIGRPIGYGYLRHAESVSATWAQSGQYELIVAEKREPCRIHFAPLWDPSGARIRA